MELEALEPSWPPESLVPDFVLRDLRADTEGADVPAEAFDLLLKTEALLGADCRPRMLPLLAMAVTLALVLQHGHVQ